MSFAEIFKKGFLNVAELSDTTILGAALAMTCALVIGLFIFFIYRKFYGGVVYNRNFNISLILMSLLTSMIIMTVSSNIVLSLGMVGALSIVRFRTAIKDPVDLVFLFWSIAAGISSGARLYVIAAGCSVFIGVVFILLSFSKWRQDTYLLILNYDDKAAKGIAEAIKPLKSRLRSKMTKVGFNETTYEIKVKNDDIAFLDNISALEGVNNATLVAYDGDFAS